MGPKLVIGNWKSNGRHLANESLLEALLAHPVRGVEVAVCAPFPYLDAVARLVAGSAVRLGAQNISEYADGAFTGEVSAGMLVDCGCRFVIVGHSERRALFAETDEVVARKAVAALNAQLVPVVCVGETLAERDAGQVEVVIQRQLDALLTRLDAQMLARIVIAYEPVWAIGTGRSAAPEDVQAVLSFIRRWLKGNVGDAAAVSVLYGGSVKPGSAGELFSLPDCDGGLIGGASLVPADFIAICEAAAAVQVKVSTSGEF